MNIPAKTIKKHIFILVNATLLNPTFGTQTKEELTSGKSTWGSSWEPKPAFWKEFWETEIEKNLLGELQLKQVVDLGKDYNGKKTRRVDVDKLEDAEWAGTAKSGECSLFLTEGDSALAMVISGFTVIGKQRYGGFPLRGKVFHFISFHSMRRDPIEWPSVDY